ncbi:MAG: hypothetical protein KAW52_04985 [candidate division Zixibacteria bacterium]|nr:hypothetical protein [candidate division Zixibacteria bacterium]
METFSMHLQSWQKDHEGIPIFRGTEDAIAYAHLVVDDDYERGKMKVYMTSVYRELDDAREAGHIPLQGLLNMACRCQLYRECVEEIDRIKDERISL